jgi:hypothetical protein
MHLGREIAFERYDILLPPLVSKPTKKIQKTDWKSLHIRLIQMYHSSMGEDKAFAPEIISFIQSCIRQTCVSRASTQESIS